MSFNKAMNFKNFIFKTFQTSSETKILQRSLCTANFEGLNVNDMEELRIPVPWGHIAAVRWGNPNKKPILALHGWQDNAFTWRPLIPNLSKDFNILAIDFPGHGLSSQYPPGMTYGNVDNLLTIRRIVKYFGWASTALMGHSMGAITTFMYSCMFPKEMDFAIQLDNIKPLTSRKKMVTERISQSIDQLIFEEERNKLGTEPPSYTFEDMKLKMSEGVVKGSIPIDKAHHILERGTQKSSTNPEQYFFTRDRRLLHTTAIHLSHSDVLMMVEKHCCPLLYIRFNESIDFEPKELEAEVLAAFRKSNTFEEHHITGTHHGHLSHPEVLAPYVNAFIQKYSK